MQIRNYVTLIRNWCVTANSHLLELSNISLAVTHPTKDSFKKKLIKTHAGGFRLYRRGFNRRIKQSKIQNLKSIHPIHLSITIKKCKAHYLQNNQC